MMASKFKSWYKSLGADIFLSFNRDIKPSAVWWVPTFLSWLLQLGQLLKKGNHQPASYQCYILFFQRIVVSSFAFHCCSAEFTTHAFNLWRILKALLWWLHIKGLFIAKEFFPWTQTRSDQALRCSVVYRGAARWLHGHASWQATSAAIRSIRRPM